MSKANKDGWVRHRGGKCPVEAEEMVDVRFRDGDISRNKKAYSFWWDHNDCNSDIMAWRPHKPEQVTDEQSLDVEMPAAKYFDGPIQWRDRIREIDATAIALNEERASLVAKLKAEGFALIQSDEPNSVAESYHQDIAQQDMSDPANWRVGDLLERISGENPSVYTYGELYKIIGFEEDGVQVLDDVNGGSYCVHNGEALRRRFKWHSRPAT